ncbi:Sir2 family NAD-dependent protein deacetylase [Actinomadura litoris]|uniref:Sir2 family NAD-dependent protein deacetylase n=1 Tax=Actinomadura litoris TaxID=2678616 RepID=UPI001FA7F122|nr:Sir2 family NAD-dependent protein deacetylase [Actinomadura litoris]
MTDIPDWAFGVGDLVVFSGAGVSTDSGIPDFRGPKGAWTKDPGSQHRHTYQAFMADPDLRVSYWRSRYEHEVWAAEPNASHRAVAGLAGSDIDTTVVTQNTDGLHQRAGTPDERVVELHGTMHVTVCTRCEDRTPTADVLARIGAGETDPPCARCGGILKTASTMFGQTMSPRVFSRAERAVLSCDLVLAVGTTLAVEPAGSLCATAVRAGAALVIVNLGSTAYDGIATEIVREPIGEALPRIVEQLRAGRHAVRPAPAAPEEDGPEEVPRPSALLRPEARTARFHAGAGDLEPLVAWCAGGGARARLLWGPPGAGKSRLALELTDRVPDAAFLVPGDPVPEGGPPLLVVDDAETRREEVAQVLAAARERPRARVLLLARTRVPWWDDLRSPSDSEQELTASDNGASGAVREEASDYAAALGLPAGDPAGTTARTPGERQATVLAALLGGGDGVIVRNELAHLRGDAFRHGLALPGDVVRDAAATALVAGAADEAAALGVLDHIGALGDPALRLGVARWLRTAYPPAGTSYWAEALPDRPAEDLIAAVVTPKFLVGMLMETTGAQDARALTVLARAAATRPDVRARLTELLSVLPGISPAAVEAALNGGYPGPLADALTSLARAVALPAELLRTVPAGTAVLGEFPVLLAQSLVEAYERRLTTHPGSAPQGLATMLAELAERLADLGRFAEALTAARRAVATAERLPERHDHLERAARSLRRASESAPTHDRPPLQEGEQRS